MRIKGEGEIAVFNAKYWGHRNRVELIEFVANCHDAKVVSIYRVSSPWTVLTSKSEDYTTALEHLQIIKMLFEEYNLQK